MNSATPVHCPRLATELSSHLGVGVSSETVAVSSVSLHVAQTSNLIMNLCHFHYACAAEHQFKRTNSTDELSGFCVGISTDLHCFSIHVRRTTDMEHSLAFMVVGILL